jgi:hypothetical protein
MADAACFDFDEHFLRVGLRLIDVFDAQRRFEFAEHGGFHCLCLNGLGMRDSRPSHNGMELL